MKVLFYVFGDAKRGMGHLVRCEVLAEECRQRGYAVDFVESPTKGPEQIERELTLPWIPDWLVVDTPEDLPDELFDIARKNNIKTLLLNGDGHHTHEVKADLTIIQGFAENAQPHVGPDYVLLRPELFERTWHAGIRWMVFGGAADVMGLREVFDKACTKVHAFVLETAYSPRISVRNLLHHVRYVRETEIFDFMFSCKAACVAMGMTAWELAALGVPTYVFSHTEMHLSFAKRMEAAGLVCAYPTVGLPSPAEMAAFLKTPFVPTGQRPDGHAAERILNLMLAHGMVPEPADSEPVVLEKVVPPARRGRPRKEPADV